MFLFQSQMQKTPTAAEKAPQIYDMLTIKRVEITVRNETEVEAAMRGTWLFDRTIKALRNDGYNGSFFIDSDISKVKGLTESMLTKNYLGDALYAHSLKSPLMVFVLAPYFSRAMEGGFGPSMTAGYYVPNTNAILLRDPEALGSNALESLWRLVFPKENFQRDGASYDENELTLTRILLHEAHHRYSYRRSDIFVSYGGKKDDPPNWLDEGITEFLTLRLMASSKIPVPNCSYIGEVEAIHLLSQVADPDVIKQAYFSGDFTVVMKQFDAKLGQGAFRELMRYNYAADAIDYLENLMDDKNIKYDNWDEDAATLGTRIAGARK